MKELGNILKDALGKSFELDYTGNSYFGQRTTIHVYYNCSIGCVLICIIYFDPGFTFDNEYDMGDPDFPENLINDLVLLGEMGTASDHVIEVLVR